MPNKAAKTASFSGTRTRMEQLVAEVDQVISQQKTKAKSTKKPKKK